MASDHTLSSVTIGGESLSIGMINPSLPARVKAAAYVDLLLAPPGAAYIAGEPSAILKDNFANSDLTRMSSVDKEIIAATWGLNALMNSGAEGPAIVGEAMAKRPAVLSTLAAWLAYTPHLDDGQEPAHFESATGLDFRDPEATDALPLTPEQRSVQYHKAIFGSVSLLLCAGDGKGDSVQLVREHLVGSRHFRNAMLRLVALVGRWSPVPVFRGSEKAQDEGKAAMQLALTARNAICAIASAHRAGLDFIDEAHHPFLNCSARSLVEAIRINSPQQLPAKGARHPDDPLTASDYLQLLKIGASLGVGLLLVYSLWQYVAWPLLRWSCLTVFALPGRVLRWVMGTSITVA